MDTLLPPELFGKIISFLEDDMHDLYRCALVSRTFHRISTPLLYKRIHVSPPQVGLAWQVVEDTLGRKPFAASRLPSHCAFVQEFVLDGYITKVGPPRQTPMPIISRIPETLRLWSNLKAVTLTPRKVSDSSLMNLVEALRHCPSLRSITVNELAMEENLVPYLTQVTGLEDLTLINPTRAVFIMLRDWLHKNQHTLVALKLTGNCGSLTPGILRAIVPYISGVRKMAIGLSYSLTNADIFSSLSQLSRLQSLNLTYYRQCAILPPNPVLPMLQNLTVLHETFCSKEDARAFSAWIRSVTTSSPLESLKTISSGRSGSKFCFDGLISHMASKHHAKLREFRMPMAYVRGPAIQSLFNQCKNLQHISLTVAFRTLQALPTMTIGLSDLRTVSLDICDRPGLVLEKKDALKIMERVPQLRCITVRKVTWKGAWVAQMDKDGRVKPEFVVNLIPNVTRDRPLNVF